MNDYQQNLVKCLERRAVLILESAGYADLRHKAAYERMVRAVELMAAQFNAGDYDAELMARYTALAGDDDLDADVAEITQRVISEIETFRPKIVKADDLLRAILLEMGA